MLTGEESEQSKRMNFLNMLQKNNSNASLLKVNVRPVCKSYDRNFRLTKYLLILVTNSFLFGFMFVDFLRVSADCALTMKKRVNRRI